MLFVVCLLFVCSYSCVVFLVDGCCSLLVVRRSFLFVAVSLLVVDVVCCLIVVCFPIVDLFVACGLFVCFVLFVV